MIRITGHVNREQWYLDRCRGRRVLHLGCVGFTDCSVEDKIRLSRQTLHQRLSEVSQCVGVDLDAETVGQLRSAGVFTNIRVGDAENLDACTQGVEPFDLVVAGDIIEHLSNPGKMLDGARRLLKPGGALLVSTPNAFGLMGFLRYLRGSFREGEQHVMSFNALNLAQLLARHGYRVTEALTCHQEHARSAHKLGFRAGVWWFRRFPKWGGTLLLVAEPSR